MNETEPIREVERSSGPQKPLARTPDDDGAESTSLPYLLDDTIHTRSFLSRFLPVKEV